MFNESFPCIQLFVVTLYTFPFISVLFVGLFVFGFWWGFFLGGGVICTSDFLNCKYVVTLNNINLTKNVSD